MIHNKVCLLSEYMVWFNMGHGDREGRHARTMLTGLAKLSLLVRDHCAERGRGLRACCYDVYGPGHADGDQAE